MDQLGYVWAAYSAVWLLIFGYTLVLGSRQNKIVEEIRLLQEALDKKNGR